MFGLLIPVLVGCAVGAVRVRSLAGLQRMRIEWWPLALGSIAVQLVLFNPPVDRQPWALAVGPYIWVACLIAQVAILVRNGLSVQPGRRGFLLAAAGLGLNLFVVLANGGHMPQSMEARLAARGTSLAMEEAQPRLRNVAPAGFDTRFGWLGDVIPEPAWLPAANVLSVGDLVLSTALAWWILRVVSVGGSTQARRQMADSR